MIPPVHYEIAASGTFVVCLHAVPRRIPHQDASRIRLFPINGGFPTTYSAAGHSALRGLTYRSTSVRADSSGTSSPVTGWIFIVRPSQRVTGFKSLSTTISLRSQASTASRHSMLR